MKVAQLRRVDERLLCLWGNMLLPIEKIGVVRDDWQKDLQTWRSIVEEGYGTVDELNELKDGLPELWYSSTGGDGYFGPLQESSGGFEFTPRLPRSAGSGKANSQVEEKPEVVQQVGAGRTDVHDGPVRGADPEDPDDADGAE